MHRDLIVFSHLRWTWVYQRPQHLVSRIGADRRVWFVEEPLQTATDAPRLELEGVQPGLARTWLEIPDEGATHLGFEGDVVDRYAERLPHVVGGSDHRIVWLYSPLALDAAEAMRPDVLVYDVMDDLASFKGAPRHLTIRHRQALQRADVVFAGGRSLHAGVVDQRPDAHLFPSGVDPAHYERARLLRAPRTRPVAGYVGVIDERLDLDLVGGLARELPDWEIRMVGPVAKIDERDLPRARNITYTGPKAYDELPQVMGDFDVALMPFALNEATRSISPTKTLEHLAAGLPVVSTRVPDVVAGYTGVVDLQDDAAGFAAACREVLHHDLDDRDRKLRPILHANHWDTIARRMGAIIAGVGTSVIGTVATEVPA